ncbi:hypothetical protein FSP39_010215 [Pinctada imbricata]|uniref:tRNA (guanine(9)-N(1))-methyltransferase n=1 Tax=Pinctada imbricata TaxID=66713 RepID=A0AA88XR64_PINIB|nr:hypothetical protein FSP39_010215 [Pinctada imbricata]
MSEKLERSEDVDSCKNDTEIGNDVIDGVEKSTTSTSMSSYDDDGNEIKTGAQMSKRQLRKLKKQEKWLLIKADKRAKEKEKKKQKKREAMAKGENLGPSRKRLKDNTMGKSECKVKAVIDCGFDSYMSEKDIMKLTKQVQFCYSTNRRADNPLQYYVTGVHGQMKDRLQRIGDYVNWDVNFAEKNYFEIFKKEDIVYLSSDSPNVLNDLDPEKAYIIGGLVDHNHHKGLCHQLAEERGINHAQLPLTEYLDMKTRKVLTINHVFEILLRYTETKDWKEAFFAVLPQRKGAKLKSDVPESKSSSEEDDKDADSDDDGNDDDKSDGDDRLGKKDDEAPVGQQTAAAEKTNTDSQHCCTVSKFEDMNVKCENLNTSSDACDDKVEMISNSGNRDSNIILMGDSRTPRTKNCSEEENS